MVRGVIEKLKEQADPCEVNFLVNQCPPITADRHLLEIMLTNIIGNAAKFTRMSKDPKVEFGSVEDQGETVYFVKDNGIGFNMEYVEKLYQPFHRLHPDLEIDGSGIGLAIVNRIIRSHEGKIWVDSREGEGTTFYFNL